MAEESKNTEAAQQSGDRPFSDRRRNLLTVAVVGILMLLEGAGLVVAVKYLGGEPAPAGAAEGAGDGAEGTAASELHALAEVPVTDLMAFNSQNGRVFVYQMSVYVQVEADYAHKVRELLEVRQNTIDDRLSKVIRAADPKYLDEAGLETLTRQFKHELAQILGDEALIKEVLFPEFSKSRAD